MPIENKFTEIFVISAKLSDFFHAMLRRRKASNKIGQRAGLSQDRRMSEDETIVLMLLFLFIELTSIFD